MCKVLIVDDEQNICKLIQNLIDWDKMNMEVVGTANNGLDAFRLMQELRPHIVISDIRMSGYDGIELIQHAKEAGIEASFIFVSGYRHFEYAKNAMKYGAVDYLLKPIKKNELTQILMHLSKQIQERQVKEQQAQATKQTLSKSKQLINRQLMQYLENEETVSEEVLRDSFELEMKDRIARVAIIKLSGEDNDEFQQQKDLILYKISASIVLNSQEDIQMRCSVQNDELTVLAVFSPDHAAMIQELFARLWLHHKDLVAEYGKYQISVGCCSEAVPVDGLHAAYHTAQQALAMRFLRGSNMQIELTSKLPAQLSFQSAFPDGLHSVYTALIAFDKSTVRSLLDTAFDAIRSNEQAIPENLFEGLDTLAHYVREAYGNVDTAQIEKIRLQPRQMSTYTRLKEELFCLLEQAMESSYEKKQYQDELPIRIGKKYVEKNYAQTVSLEEVAAAVCLNPNYFSVLFKKMTGINFSEYLTDYRLERARQLLRTTTMNLAQVSDAVGYKDARYFSKLFTKIVGLKPNEYRKLYRD